MKLSAYKELDSSKRAQTLSRIILIAGAHIVIIGGAFLVTKFGDKGPVDPNAPSLAGVGTWSSQSSTADQPSVDAASGSLFDSRASDLSGYNAGEGERQVLLASNTASTNSAAPGRYAPRRPSDSGSSNAGSSSTLFPSTSSPSSNDDVLQPVRRQSDELYPSRTSSAPSSSLSQTIEYKIQNGDSLWGISQRFKVKVADITSANPGIKANAIRVGQTIKIPRSTANASLSIATPAQAASSATKPPANGTIYKVKAGDSLSRIASRQGLTVSQLKAANGLSSDMIRIGQELVIPSTRKSSAALVSQQHRGPKVTVKAGDSVSKIAAVYGVSSTELMRLNNITDPALLRIGQTILIPEGGRASSVTRTVTPPPAADPVRSDPVPTQSQPLQTLDQLQPRATPQSSTSLPTLDDAFGAEDLEDQPLIPIKE
ncbi:muramidase family protein [Pelagicoccus mobilis]|uniref:LysM peptidoglycan-binding domain-containing protein n=1 Tax=Pelagicoccus mobilis TaxID=415221 RepID=A0A934RUD0_9BACT|nr:LysM peptidoglycan-binding domain-containing protein [Pelagicoccus mobilis]MBK1876581.1 LysM peptidoglycan-binding domain-containing protein [Pelagicoccus mobilis]